MLKNFKIDPHVHFRDQKEAYKETISHGLDLAKNQGVKIVFDMPNTKPPLLGERELKERLKLVPQNEKGRYFLYLGVTPKEKQIEEAVFCYQKYKEVIGFKMYAGESVGGLGIVSVEDQERVYRILSKLNYQGVIAVHCEKEKYLRKNLFNPKNPISHFYSRPKEAEIEAIKDQIKLVKKTNFNGHLHIVHISTAESAEIINKARKEILISGAVTPHHILWTKDKLKEKNGLLYKTNPPLREREEVEKLREFLKEGKIDWIETDHAPHQIGEKLFPPYLSGFPSLYIYKEFVEKFLPQLGLSHKQIKELTFENIYKVFKNKLDKL
jgi:dihydroorotase